jgi:hypothetical protein
VGALCCASSASDGPAVRLQRRREQPLRPARDRHVRHSPNPDYFINPPAFTYVIYALFTVRWGTDPATIGGAFAADPTTAFALARAGIGVPGRARRLADAIAGARLFDDRRVGLLAGRAARGRVPAEPLQPLRAQRRADAGRRWRRR